MFIKSKPHILKSGKITYYYYLVEIKRKGRTVVSKVKKRLKNIRNMLNREHFHVILLQNNE